MADVADVTRAMQQLFKPEKINYGAYSDKLSHLHFHLAPKYVDGPDYGGTFRMNPGEVYLTEAEYDEMWAKYFYIIIRFLYKIKHFWRNKDARCTES